MQHSVLVDITRCIGCQGCQVACKSWNERPSERTTLGPTMGNPGDMDSSSYTVIRFREEDKPWGLSWHFTKQQCMHCNEPACVSACPVGALTKDQSGPVTYNKRLCIGCRYCMLACPFSVPKFEWDKAFPYIQKCTFCAERLKAGEQPACTKACPSGALVFGKRDDIVALAKRRMADRPGRYKDRIYGLEEAGGTSWLYLADTEPANMYLPDGLENVPYGTYTWSTLKGTAAAGVGVAAIMTAFFFISGRRAQLEESEKANGGPEK